MSDLKQWQWCGHAYFIGRKNSTGQSFQERNETLRRFGTPQSQAIKNYIRYMADGINDGRADCAGILPTESIIEIAGAGKGWPAVIGDRDFVKQAMNLHEVRAFRKHRKSDYQEVLHSIANIATTRYKIAFEELFIRGRESNRSNARALFCHMAHVEELIPFSVIARYLRITIPSATALADRAETAPPAKG